MMTTTTTTTTKTLTALALAAAALTVMVGPSEAAPRLTGVHVAGTFHEVPPGPTGVHVAGTFHEVPPPKISCFACNLPHGGQGGARPPGYGWGYGDHRPHGWGWGYGNHWPYHGWGYGYGNHWPYYGYGYRWPYYGYYKWYRWHPAYYGGAPVAAEPVAAPVASIAAPQAPIGGCDCLTKKMLPNGAELLQDICTKQSAVAPPQALSAR